MKIDLACHVDILRAKNYPNLVVQFAEAFAFHNIKTELIVPHIYRKGNIKKDDIFTSYGLQHKFKITFLKTLIFKNTPKKLQKFQFIFFHMLRGLHISLRYFLNLEKEKRIIISTYNDILIPYILIGKVRALKNLKTIVWEHEFIKRKISPWIYRNCSGIIATNSAIKEDLEKEFGIQHQKILISSNPVSKRRLDFIFDKKEIRKKIELDANSILIVYTGKLGIGIKEIEYILKAASFLPNFTFVLTNGTPKVVDYYKKILNQRAIKNVILTGYLPKYEEIKNYQCAADVLISYYSRYDLNIRACPKVT